MIEVIVRIEQHLHHPGADLGDGFGEITGSGRIPPVDHHKTIRSNDQADIPTVARKSDDSICDFCCGDRSRSTALAKRGMRQSETGGTCEQRTNKFSTIRVHHQPPSK